MVTRVGGLPEAVRGLDPSLIVESGSPDALAERLLGPRPTRVATRAFAANHSWHSVAARHAGLYKSAMVGGTSARRRVGYLDHTARMSGGEIALLRLLPHLSNTEPHVILAEDGPFADALTAQGISVEVMTMPARARSATRATMRLRRLSPAAAVGSALYTVRLARRLRSLRPDLVHTNSLKAGIYGGSPHERPEFRKSGTCAIGLPPTIPGPGRRGGPIPHLQAALGLYRQFRGDVTDCRDGSAGGRASFRRAGDRSPGDESRRRVPMRRDGVRHRRTTRAMERPGCLPRAFARAFPDGNQRAVIIGSALFGDEDACHAAGLAALARELCIGDRVEFRGHRDNVSAELARIDVLVHASTIPEPFGMVIVEGMASGLAVVASAEGGPLEIITPGVDGELAPPGDVDRLADRLCGLDADPHRRSRLGEAAERRSRDFRPEPVAAAVERCYESVLDDTGRGRSDAIAGHRTPNKAMR